jgi:DNA-binding NtrC family response regulator
VPLELPPLRERREDVRRLAQHFLERAREEAGRGPRRVSRAAIAALERFPWPGNVRELHNAIEHAVALAEGETLELEDLPRSVAESGRAEELREAVRTGQLGFEAATAQFERELLQEALDRNQGNQTRAAAQLWITRRALKLRVDRLGIKSERSAFDSEHPEEA